MLVEPLAPRLLLSVTLGRDRILRIVGTDARDEVLVTADPHFVNLADVTVNGATIQYALSDIGRIDIRTLGGDDAVRIDPSLNLLGYPAYVDAGQGNDRVSTGSGRDTILGGEDNDKIWSNGGDDRIDGQGGRDTITAGSGNDTVNGDSGSDRLRGQSGNDSLDGGAGNDRVDGNEGDDVLSDKAGRDTVSGGAGNDTGTFKDRGRVHGGDGADHLVAAGNASVYGDAGNDALAGHIVFGGAGNDTIAGTPRGDALNGDDGNDVLTAGAGEDLVVGGAGNDALYGGTGDDALHGGAGDDNLYAGDAPAVMNAVLQSRGKYDAGHDLAMGEAGRDWFELKRHWSDSDLNRGDGEAGGSQNLITGDPGRGLYGKTLDSSDAIVRYTLTGDADLEGKVDLSDFTFTGANFNQMPNWVEGDFNYDGRIDVTDFTLLASNFGQSVATTTTPPPTTTINDDIDANGIPYGTPYSVARFSDGFPGSNLGFFATNAPALVTGGRFDANHNIIPPTFSDAQRQQLRVALIAVPGYVHITSMMTVDNDVVWYGLDGSQFLAVKRGAVLVSDESGAAAAAGKSWNWMWFPLNEGLTGLPDKGEIRIAGQPDVYHLGGRFLSAALPANSGSGIRVQEGVVWLPTDGSLPSFNALAG